MLMGMEPPNYVLWVLKSIKSTDLEQSLLVLPLGHAERLLYYLVLVLKCGHSSVELCCRAAIFTVKTFQKQVRVVLKVIWIWSPGFLLLGR
jgi:U3 small nucleolar RNA-associated protein 12